MMPLLISGPKQPGNDIDVYLAPLIEDLKELWDFGMEVFDAYGNESFTLRVALLWTVNDFPAYGNLSGHKVKGEKACPICGSETCLHYLPFSKKNVYLGHRRFLPRNHRYRKNRKDFNGEKEKRIAPTIFRVLMSFISFVFAIIVHPVVFLWLAIIELFYG